MIACGGARRQGRRQRFARSSQFEGDRRQIEARAGRALPTKASSRAPLAKRQARKSSSPIDQQVVARMKAGYCCQHLRRHRLAVQPLLQVEKVPGASRITSNSPSSALESVMASARSGKAPEMSSPVRE
jgi:hypothetical protein